MIDRLHFREAEGYLFEQLNLILSVTLQEIDLFNSHMNLKLEQKRPAKHTVLTARNNFFFLILEHTFLYLKLLKGGAVRIWPKETLLGQQQQQQPWGYSWSCTAKPEHNSSACILHTLVWFSKAGDPILQPSILI